MKLEQKALIRPMQEASLPTAQAGAANGFAVRTNLKAGAGMPVELPLGDGSRLALYPNGKWERKK